MHLYSHQEGKLEEEDEDWCHLTNKFSNTKIHLTKLFKIDMFNKGKRKGTAKIMIAKQEWEYKDNKRNMPSMRNKKQKREDLALKRNTK